MDTALLLAVFDQRAAAWQTQLRRCRSDFDEEAVHDLRVAIRRLLALLDLLRGPGFALRGKKLRRALKSQLVSLGRLRDIQVMVGETALLLPAGLACSAFLLHLRACQQCERAVLARVLADCDDEQLARRLAKQRHRLARGEHDCATGLQIALNVAWARFWRCHAHASRESPASIHRERVAGKRYRYCLEILLALSADTVGKNSLKVLRDYQDRLGELQDAQVLLHAVQQYSRNGTVAGTTDLCRAASRLCDARLAVYWRQRGSLAALQLPFVQ